MENDNWPPIIRIRYDSPMLELHRRVKRRRATHNQGFDGSAPVTEVAVNLKIYVQRVGLNLCKGGLEAAYWARISRLEHERRILKTHVLSLRQTLVRCGLRTLDKRLFFSSIESSGALLWRLERPDSPKSKRGNLYKIAHLARLSTGSSIKMGCPVSATGAFRTNSMVSVWSTM